MQLVISPEGSIRCVYSETLDLSSFGLVSILRASHVEPDREGIWQADLSPVGGPILKPFATRSLALAAEQAWLEHHWIDQPPPSPPKQPPAGDFL